MRRPLRNASGDPTQEYFADGMTEAIIMDLARIKALRVISRTSAMQYKGTTKSLPEIARELNVDAVLEGSAHLVGERVRVSVQLIAARSDETLWSDRYDRDLVDVLTLQSELAEVVAREIAVQLTPAEAGHLARRQTVNPEAHLEVYKARHSMFAGTKDALDVALRHARRALELAPDYAPAWSALADCQIVRVVRGMASPAEAGAEAWNAATRARDLDPESADAWTSLGFIVSNSGDVAGGLESLQRAIELDPLSSLIRTVYGDALYYAREYQQSVFHCRMAIELDPRFDGAHTDIARALEALGRFDEARAAYEEGRRLGGGIAGPSFGLAHLEAAAGNVDEARRILAELTAARESRVVSAWGIGALHASLGDVDEAFRWLEIAIAEKASGLMWLRTHPRLDAIRGDARYWLMMERVGLG